jgi:regulator of protease activity HflC (stomatin/prohibitin superfamily)
MLALAATGIGVGIGYLTQDWRWGIPIYAVALYLLFAFKVALQWERAVLLRLGKFRRVAGPGHFWVLPLVDRTAA